MGSDENFFQIGHKTSKYVIINLLFIRFSDGFLSTNNCFTNLDQDVFG